MTQATQQIAADNMSLFDSNADMTAALVSAARAILATPQAQSLLLSGGSSPCDFYEALGQENLPWGEINVAWSMSAGLMKMTAAPMPLW